MLRALATLKKCAQKAQPDAPRQRMAEEETALVQGQDTTSAKWNSDFPVGGHHLRQRIWDREYEAGKNPGIIIQSFNMGILAVCYVIDVVLDVAGILILERHCPQRT